MRGKDFNAGLRGALFEAKHHARMGAAIWLYGWLVLRETRQVGATGLVLGGRPVSYREIGEETGFGRKTLERWMRVLRRQGYIETRAVPSGIVVRITKAKKFAPSAQFPQLPQAGSATSRAPLRGGEGSPPQGCGGNMRHALGGREVPVRMGSNNPYKHNIRPSFPLLKYVKNGISQANSGTENASLDSSGASHGAGKRLTARASSRENALRLELTLGAGPQLKCANGDEGG
jgi:hypothetical protein